MVLTKKMNFLDEILIFLRLRAFGVVVGVHEELGQPLTKSFNLNLQIVVTLAHSTSDEVLILKTLRRGIMSYPHVLGNDILAAHIERLFGDGHAVFERERNITHTIPHGVDFQKLLVRGEALHLFLPEAIVRECDVTGGMEETIDESVNRAGAHV